MASAWQDGQQSESDGAPSSTLSETVVDEIPMTTRDAVLTEACGDEAIRAHCLRVATWSSELASAIGLSEARAKGKKVPTRKSAKRKTVTR